MCYAGFASTSLLKVKVQVQSPPRRRTCGVTLHALHCSATQNAPLLQLRIRSSAKSIAACRMHLQKKLHGVLRGDMRGTPRIPTSLLLYRYRCSAKSIAACKLQSPKKICMVGCDVLRGVGI